MTKKKKHKINISEKFLDKLELVNEFNLFDLTLKARTVLLICMNYAEISQL
jgi:hypothetical protein